MVTYKLRTGAYQTNGDPIMVLTVPEEVAVFFEETHFTIEKSGCCILFTSGTKSLSRKDLEAYNYEDCRVI